MLRLIITSGREGDTYGAQVAHLCSLLYLRAHIPLKKWKPMQMKLTQNKKEMYMANARILRLGPDATYITLGVLRWG